MVSNNGKERYLPSREISYAYTVAMYFGQLLEINLRAVLYTTDYHGWGAQVELDEFQLKRFKDMGEFLDKATCGLVIEKLRATGVIKDRRAMRTFQRACEHRNKLAHSFLSQENFDNMTKPREADILRRLNTMTIDIYQALLISRGVRVQVEKLADKEHIKMQKLFAEFGPDYDNPYRYYSTRKQKQKS